LPNEIDWDTVTKESGADDPLIEYTSVTKKVRRVARFHPEVVREAICVNNPTEIVMNHLDYIDRECHESNEKKHKVLIFIDDIENYIGKKINYYGFGPDSMIPASYVKSGARICLI
jgi:adenylosuccinate synthase